MPIPELSEEVHVSSDRHRRRLLIVAACAVCLVVAAIVVKRMHAGGDSASVSAEGAGGAVYAAVAPVKRETIANSLSIAGQFMPYQNVELHAKVAGYIKHIDVDIGDRVHQGQVLAVLEIPEMMAQVEAAKAGVHR